MTRGTSRGRRRAKAFGPNHYERRPREQNPGDLHIGSANSNDRGSGAVEGIPKMPAFASPDWVCQTLLGVSRAAMALLALVLPAVAADLPPDVGRLAQSEQFVWGQLHAGGEADLDKNCDHEHPAVTDAANPEWNNACRTIRAVFVRDLLARPAWTGALPNRGITIKGARIGGNLDLENAKPLPEIWISNSRFEGDIILRHARTESVIGLSGGTLRIGAFGFRRRTDQ